MHFRFAVVLRLAVSPVNAASGRDESVALSDIHLIVNRFRQLPFSLLAPFAAFKVPVQWGLRSAFAQIVLRGK